MVKNIMNLTTISSFISKGTENGFMTWRNVDFGIVLEYVSQLFYSYYIDLMVSTEASW